MRTNVFRFLLIAATLAACRNAESKSGAAESGGGEFPPMPVEVVSAVQDTVADVIVATGQIEAVQAIELKPDVEGRIVDILVREGAVVAQGTPLFKVDDGELKAQVAQLEAERDLAQQALRRTRDLLAQNASSPADLERAEATARSTQAQLDLAQLRLERTTVRAPFSGAVGARSVSIGDYVTRSTPLVTLQTIDPQRAVFDVPERYAPKLAVGQQVTFAVAAMPEQRFSGQVDFVDPRVALPGRTITVKARVPNPQGELKAGMFIEARLVAELRPNAILVAEDAILPLEGATYVWVAKDGAAQRREVQLGVRIPGWVEVTSGVEGGEPVVVAGQERLSEGQPVAPTVLERKLPS